MIQYYGVVGACPYKIESRLLRNGYKMDVWVWNCESDKLYILQIMNTRYVAKYLHDIQFYTLFNMETQTTSYMSVTYDARDRIYTYKTAKERGQEQMEARALQLILTKAIGDPTFTTP